MWACVARRSSWRCLRVQAARLPGASLRRSRRSSLRPTRLKSPRALDSDLEEFAFSSTSPARKASSRRSRRLSCATLESDAPHLLPLADKLAAGDGTTSSETDSIIEVLWWDVVWRKTFKASISDRGGDVMEIVDLIDNTG